MSPTSRALAAASPKPGAIGVIGAGRLGTTLALALQRVGMQVSHVASERMESAEQLSARLPNARAVAPELLCEHANVVVLTVPDAAIAGVAASLPIRAGQSLIHCSGALDLRVLDAARDRGAAVGCLHPLQTFPQRFDESNRFAGITCGIEASAQSATDASQLDHWLTRTCAALGARCVQLAGIDRASYHAAAVLASNYVIALHAAAAQAWQLAGLPIHSAREALAPLTVGAAHALQQLPLPQALTGPVARADVGTLEQHLQALARSPDLLELYRALARKLLDLPIDWTPEERARMAALLERS